MLKTAAIRLTMLFASLLAGCGGRSPTGWTFSVPPTYANVPYASASSVEMLDIYLPQGNGPFPVIVYIHGGGWRLGHKGMVVETLGKALLQAGYAIASLDYRLSNGATFPAAVLDIKAATRFLRFNAAQYHLDPNRFAAMGESAGGNLAAMLGVSGDLSAYDDPALGNPGVSSRVQAVIDWYGPVFFSLMDNQGKAQGCAPRYLKHSTPGSFESLYLGGALARVPDLVKQASPLSYITSDDPPFLVQQGDQDCAVPAAQSQMLVDALKASGVEVQYTLLHGGGHGDSDGLPVYQSPENIQLVLLFLKSKLK
jgi:acetyl esterase/lipase